MDNAKRRYEEPLKRSIVSEIESGRMSIADAAREYGVGKSRLFLWLKEYGTYRPKREVIEVVMKSEKERIAELEKALADATLKARVYEELINQANKALKVDIKKTFGTGLSELSEEGAKESRKSVKRSK